MDKKPTLISRKDAALKIGRETNYEGMRNYEMEHALEEIEGGEWIINEWCPFNGIHCGFFDVAPIKFLEQTIEEMQHWTDIRRNLIESLWVEIARRNNDIKDKT